MADILKTVGEAFGFAKRAAPTQTIGTSRTTGNVMTGEGAGTFDEPDYDLNLVGQRRWTEFERMVRDIAIIGAGTRLFLNLISSAVWTVNPPEGLNGNEEPVAQEYADFVYKELFGMTTSWSSVVKKTAAFRLNGFTIQEWTAKHNDDGTIGLKDIEHRPQKTITKWNRDEGGTVEAVVQRVTGRPDVTLPRSKIVYAVDDTLTDSPEGMGLFRHMAATANRLEVFMQLQKIGFATDLRGIPVGRAPLEELRNEVTASGPDGSPPRVQAEARRNSLLAPIRDFLRKHVRNEHTGAMLSSATYIAAGVDKSTTPSAVQKWGLELLTGDSQSFSDMAEAIKELKQDLARLLGAEHLLLGSDGAGSLALARSKVGTFYLTVTSTLLDLLEVYDRDIIAPVAEMNGWPEELWPEMGVNEISDRDIEQIAAFLRDLSTAGAPIMSDDPAVGELYDMIGLTRPPEREDEMDLSLMPGRVDPLNPLDPEAPQPDPEAEPEMEPTREDDGKAKTTKVLRSRRAIAKRRARAWSR